MEGGELVSQTELVGDERPPSTGSAQEEEETESRSSPAEVLLPPAQLDERGGECDCLQGAQSTAHSSTKLTLSMPSASVLSDASAALDPGPRLLEEGKSEECDEELLPFDLDVQATQDLFSMNEELQSILDPKNTLQTPPPCVDLSPLECSALQLEEIEMLKAIYDRDMTALNENGTCFVVSIKFLSDDIKDEDVIKIWFSLPPNYPCVPPVFEIEANRSGSFSYLDADELFDLLMAEAINRVGGTMIFDLVTFSQEYMPDLLQRKSEHGRLQAAADLDRQQTMELEEAVRDTVKSRGVPKEVWDVLIGDGGMQTSEGGEGGEEEEEGGEEEGGGEHVKSHYHQYHGTHKPVHFIGPISDVIKKLPDGLQISRIENILRQDLATRFKQAWTHANETLWKQERQHPQQYSLTPQIAFHGTLTRSLPSIVHQGLVIPGQRNKVGVRCGSSLGVGIYLSPSPDFSLGYSDSDRLIVCAALLGRISKNGVLDAKSPGSAYRTIECGDEWVLFNASQVLPCYVIQVSRGASSSSSHPPPLSSLLSDSTATSSSQPAQDQQSERERREKLLARARKFLPYGFGPGSKTVIEAAASFDDDEEDYGDFQMMRHEERCTQEKSALQKYRFRDAYSRTDSHEESS